MKKKFYLITALVVALALGGGIYAYAYTTATATIGITEPTGDVATCELAPNQPDWNSVLPGGGGAGTEILRPNAAGDETNIPSQYPPSEEHWDKVDDETPDDWGTYVCTTGDAYKRDLYNLPAPSGSGTINKVTVYFRFSGDKVSATIASDDFESGGWSGGSGWLYDWYDEGDARITGDGMPHGGSYHLRLRRASGYVDRAVNLAGQTNVRLQFWAKADSFEAGEYAECLVSPDDVNWTTVKTWVDGEDDNIYHFYDIDLSGFTMSSEFWIAFDAEMSGKYDYLYIDDLEVVSADAAYTGYAKAAIKTHGTVYEGSEYSQTGKTFVTKSYEWTTNPATGSAWTWDEIDALQIGVSLKGEQAGAHGFCTQVYVSVAYEVAPEICGDVPTGDLFIVTPNPDYTGDLLVKVYLVNTGSLIRAYQYLNMELTLQGADENPQLLTLQNGVATFALQNCAGGTHTLSVTGGSYCLTSATPPENCITPEFHCEVTQR